MGGFADILNKVKTGVLGAGHSQKFDTEKGYGSFYQQTEPNLLDRVKTLLTGQEFQQTPYPQNAIVPQNLDQVVKAAQAGPSEPVRPPGTIEGGYDYSGLPEGQGFMPKQLDDVVAMAQGQQPQAPQAQPIQGMGGINEDMVRKMIQVYGGEKAPALNQAPVISEAIQNYPLFKNNPELIPLLAHLETSSGRYITRPNNLINYGVRDPKINALFGSVGLDEALRRSLKEMGQTGTVYKRFDTGGPLTDEQLLDFAKTYEPMNDSYGPNLLNGRKKIRETLGY